MHDPALDRDRDCFCAIVDTKLRQYVLYVRAVSSLMRNSTAPHARPEIQVSTWDGALFGVIPSRTLVSLKEVFQMNGSLRAENRTRIIQELPLALL